MSRVKQIHEEKKSYNLLIDYNRKQKLSELRDKHSPEFSNWRGTVTEGMNTGNVFFTTLPSTGEVDLETITTQSSGSFEGVGSNSALENTVVKGSGSGTGSEGGFNIGNHLAFQGDGQPRWAILKPIDSSKFDTISIKAIRGNDNNGGEDPEAPGEQLRLYYLPPGGNSFRSISVNPDGEQVHGPDTDVIIPLGSTSDGLRNWEIALPSYARGAAFRYMLYQITNDGASFDHYGITQINYKRRAPISVFVSLDSPEAVSFISDGSGNMTPAEKKKRLEDMLSASDEYQSRQFPFNKAAYEKAAKDVARNIQISLDLDTVKFPEYKSPTWNELFPRSVTDSSSAQQIDRYMESKGLSFDNLTKDAIQKNFDRDSQLNIINTSDVENRDKFLTALGIDVGNLNNLSDDTYRKLSDSKIYIQPGGTPSTGWDGKMYEYNSPELEKSRIVPLETYLEAKKRDGFHGAERPDVVEPGHKYVMVKPFNFSQDSEARPEYTSVRNRELMDSSSEFQRQMNVEGGNYDLGLSYHYNRYLKGYSDDPSYAKSLHSLRTLMDVTVDRLTFLSRNAEASAFGWLRQNISMEDDYDPFWTFSSPAAKEALKIAQGLTSGRDLDSPVSYYTNNTWSDESKRRSELEHQRRNDITFNNIQKYLNIIKGNTDPLAFEKDEWYSNNSSGRNAIRNFVISVTTTHPYSGLTEPDSAPEEPKTEEPQEPTEEPEKDLTDISKSVSKDVKSDDEIVDELGKVSVYYKDKKIKNPEIQTPNLLKSVVNFFTGADDSLLGDVLPAAYEYGADIAASVLTGKPINLTKNDVTTRDLELMFNQLGPNEVDVFSKPEAYADDNIRELPNGNVVMNTTGTNNTKQIYKPPTATFGGRQFATDFGYSNPIGAAGQAQVQLVIPSNNPKDAYFRYNDHAYYNDDSSDRGELPLGDLDPRRIPGALVNGISRAVYPNGLQGYPSNIRGDRTLKFDVSYDELPQNFKDKVKLEIDYRSIGGGSLGDTLQGIDATDAATVSADNKKKKKTNAVAEMYEPKAKHNDKVAKVTGRLKTVSDFLNNPDVKPVFPKDPPPEMINGRHPDLVDGEKISNRFNKLDPTSAKSMPKTGNPKIDAKVAKALKRPK